jgi:uncharacterized iron-regulated protein
MIVAALVLQGPSPQLAPPLLLPSGYVPERVYDTRKREFIDFELMLAGLAGIDVIFVGEQHEDANTHRLEQALLEGMLRRRRAITVSFEMFERDVQDIVVSYLRGAIPEEAFLKQSRPWPRYATDYRPLLELAKAHGFMVVAANVPRRLASQVARSGQDALQQMTPQDRALVATDLQCPQDGYYHRFARAMTDHAESGAKAEAATPPAGAAKESSTDRYFWSQCVKDETMAESIAGAWAARPGRPVIHFTGAFHIEFGHGTVERTRRRMQGHPIATISVLPVADLDRLVPAGEDLGRADYLVYTAK